MTPEQAALFRKAQASLRGAKLLAEEELFDFAVSRAYYSMFYVAQAFLLGQGLSFSSHAAVISAFGREIARPGLVPVAFHRYLIDAQDLRSSADYNPDSGLAKADAAEQIALAQQFLDLAIQRL